MATSLQAVLQLLLLATWATLHCRGRPLTEFDIHHRFSGKVKSWVSNSASPDDVRNWPEEGTPEYYEWLVSHDHARQQERRQCTVSMRQIDLFGHVYYMFVKLGTPSVEFMVALDTGSSLFWVPGDSDNYSPPYHPDGRKFNVFSSASSSTCRNAPHIGELCVREGICTAQSGACPYNYRYLTPGTWTSGVLLEDVLHLPIDDPHQPPLTLYVVFGLATSLMGSLTKYVAPNGILGLGMARTSVPSTIAARNLTDDSFSMCFHGNRSGRITFGDKGSSNQSTAELNIDEYDPRYEVNVAGMRVRGRELDLNFTAVFDTGTSFTRLSEPVYTRYIQALGLRNNLDRRVESRDGPFRHFEYSYYYRRSGQTSLRVQRDRLLMDGRTEFVVPSLWFPTAVTTHRKVYCLGVLRESSHWNIIGLNFMTGYKIVFNRGEEKLGWQKTDCMGYKTASPQGSQAA